MPDLPLCGHSAIIVLWIGAAITVAIFGLIAHSIISFSKPVDTGAGNFVHHTKVEVVWAVIPVLVLIITAAPAVKPLIAISNSCQVVTAQLR